MAKISDEHINDIVTKVATFCNLKSWRYSVSNFDCIGQNYFGVIMPVVISGHNVKGVDTNISVVLKLAPTDERYRVSGAVTKFFLREIFVYTKLMPKYAEFQKKLPYDSQLVIPTIYYTNDEYCKEVIAMEDMHTLGYKPLTSQMFLDLKHITIAIETLAQFHALSFILKHNDENFYNIVAKECIPLIQESNKRYMDIMVDRLEKAISKFEGTKYIPLLNNLRQNCGKYFDKILTLTEEKCISHGDVWKENVLFKYEANDPVSACLIDYQTARISSPAFDILYLIISSTDTHLRRCQFDNLINLYHKTLTDNLKNAGLEAETVYHFQKFKHDLKIVAPACLITANTALWLSCGLQEEGHVKSKNILKTPEEKEKAVQDYKNIVKCIIVNYYSYGYLPIKFNVLN